MSLRYGVEDVELSDDGKEIEVLFGGDHNGNWYVDIPVHRVKKLLEASPPSDNWRRVEDELPKHRNRVLAYSKSENEYYAAKFHNNEWGWTAPGYGGLDISHWQEIKPPVEV